MNWCMLLEGVCFFLAGWWLSRALRARRQAQPRYDAISAELSRQMRLKIEDIGKEVDRQDEQLRRIVILMEQAVGPGRKTWKDKV